MSTTQEFIPIKEIRNNVVVLKNGELRLVLLCSSINFDLKSEDEQTGIIMQYQNFLNSLDFSIQLYSQSRKLDIRPYLVRLEAREKEQPNELLKIQTHEYSQFVKTFTELNNVMSKSFFAVVPYAPAIGPSKKGFLSGIFGSKSDSTRAEEDLVRFEADRVQLEQRRDVVSSGLNRIGVRTVQLKTEELVELYYKIFNPGDMGKPMQPEMGS